MQAFTGKTVLITGGAGGIGYCTAEVLVKAGNTVIITDINAVALQQAQEKLQQFGPKVYAHVADVTQKAQVDEVAAWVAATVGDLDILINNAGAGYTGELAETSLERWQQLMAINFWGPVYHTYAFLPRMIARRSGHIVNISSGQAFFRLPTWGAYAVAKLAIGAFSEILRFELKKYNIKVTTVYPFMTLTKFYDHLTSETLGQRLSMKLLPYYASTPEKVANIIVKAIKKNKAVETVSIINEIGYYSHLIPLLSDIIETATMMVLGKGRETKQQPAKSVSP